MIKFYRTDDRKIHEEGGIVPGVDRQKTAN